MDRAPLQDLTLNSAITAKAPAPQPAEPEESPTIDLAKPAPGSMGLKGLFATVGNATAMTAMVVMLFLLFFHFLRLQDQDRKFFQAERDAMTRVVEKNTLAIDRLADEMRGLRVELVKRD